MQVIPTRGCVESSFLTSPICLNKAIWKLTQANQVRCVSPSQSPYFLPPHLPPQAPRTALACHILNTCATILSVILAMSPPLSSSGDSNHRTYFKYNFASLLDSLDGSTVSNQHPNDTDFPSYPSRSKCKSPTIEFRQPCGTLEPDIMTHWIRFLGALVEFAGAISLESLIEFLGVENKGFGTGSRITEGRTINTSLLIEAQRMTRSPSTSPRATPAASLTGTQPIGSLSRLFTAMESVDTLLDLETYGFWRRKFSA